MRSIFLALAFSLATRAVASEDPARVAARLDALVAARWQGAGVEPAEPATDAEFLRRVWLDVGGRIPTAAEARAFLESPDAGKRERLVAELLSSDDYSEHWARQLGVVLIGRSPLPRSVDRAGFEGWLRDRLASGTAYDDIVRDIIGVTGNPVDAPAANYLLRFEMKPEDIAESVSSSLLGVQIGCARCHDHPYEPWSQADFYGMAASFSELELERPGRTDRRTRREYRRQVERMQRQREQNGAPTPEERRRMRESILSGAEALRRTIRLDDEPGKKLEVEIDGRRQGFSARFLDGSAPKNTPRSNLAEWIVAPENPYFARATVNRVWDALFGRGLVEPVDAFGTSNPPSHPEVVDLLASDFVANGFDLRRMLIILTTSKTYQLSSRRADALPPPELFASARPRRMSPEQLFESLVTLSGLDGRAGFDDRREPFLRQFVFLFDTDAVNDVEVAQGTIPQSLFLLNGRMTNQALSGSRPLGTNTVEELFLSAFSRFPTAEERSDVAAFLESGGARARGDALWALVNSSEFLMVH